MDYYVRSINMKENRRIREYITNRKGFTLVELVVVITILGILATIAVPKVLNYIDKANYTADIQNAKIIRDAMLLGIAVGEMDNLPPVNNGFIRDYMAPPYNGGGQLGQIIRIATNRINTIPTPKYKRFWKYYSIDVNKDREVSVYADIVGPPGTRIRLAPNPIPFKDVPK